MKIDRLLSIVITLLNREKITAAELAQYHEVSIRTIYRDLDTINLAGIPLVSCQGNMGGYGIEQSYTVNKQYFSLSDMASILSALISINQTLKNKQVDSAIGKIKSLVPREKIDEVTERANQIRFDILPWGYGKDTALKLDLLYQGISAHRRLNFRYTNYQGSASRRTVEPYSLLFKGYSWYLFAFCTQKRDFRLFRLSRIKELKLLNETFNRQCAPPPVPSEKVFGYDAGKEMVKLKLAFSPAARVRVEDVFDVEDIERVTDDRLQVNLSVPRDEWLYGFILSFGDQVQVLGPPDIRQELEKIIKKMAALYT